MDIGFSLSGDVRIAGDRGGQEGAECGRAPVVEIYRPAVYRSSGGA